MSRPRPGRMSMLTLAIILAGCVAAGLWCGAARGQECPGGFVHTAYGHVGYGAAVVGGDPADTVLVADFPQLKAACEDTGNNGKTITFAAGIDSLVFSDRINVQGMHNLTINGFSSPDSTPRIHIPGGSHGFLIKGPGGAQWNSHDILIAGLRFIYTTNDAFIQIEEGAYNVVVTHCSFGLSGDEQVTVIADGGPPASIHQGRNVTYQYCWFNQNPDAPGHRGVHIQHGRAVTLWRNMIGSGERMPRIHTCTGDPSVPVLAQPSNHIAIVNNLMFNWFGAATYIDCEGSADIVNNVYLPGPDTTDLDDAINLGSDPTTPPGPVYRVGNLFLNGSSGDAGTTGSPVTVPTHPTVAALDALTEVLAYAGAPLYTHPDSGFTRDVYDQATYDLIQAELP